MNINGTEHFSIQDDHGDFFDRFFSQKKPQLEEMPVTVGGGQRVTYTCDPDKNVSCKKSGCYINGGPCNQTVHLEFAKQPVEKARLTIPMSQEDFDSLQEAKATKVHNHPKRKGGRR